LQIFKTVCIPPQATVVYGELSGNTVGWR